MNVKEENEEKKAYLYSYRNAKQEVDRMEKELKRIYLNFGLSSPVYDGMPHGTGSSGDLSGRVIAIEESIKKLRKAQYKCNQKMIKIDNQIKRLSDQRERDVLYDRYIEGMKWEDIAEELGYTVQHIIRIHGKALYNFSIWGK